MNDQKMEMTLIIMQRRIVAKNSSTVLIISILLNKNLVISKSVDYT